MNQDKEAGTHADAGGLPRTPENNRSTEMTYPPSGPVMHEPAPLPENPAPRRRLSAAVPPGAPVNDRPVTQRGAAAEPAASAVVRAPAVLPRAGAPARPGTGRRRRAPDRQVAASPGPVVQGSTVETQQRPDSERNRDCPACPRSARFASWTKGQCIHVGVRRSSARCAKHGQSWCGSSLAVPGRDYPVRQPDGLQNSNLPSARAVPCGRCRLMFRRR